MILNSNVGLNKLVDHITAQIVTRRSSKGIEFRTETGEILRIVVAELHLSATDGNLARLVGQVLHRPDLESETIEILYDLKQGTGHTIDEDPSMQTAIAILDRAIKENAERIQLIPFSDCCKVNLLQNDKWVEIMNAPPNKACRLVDRFTNMRAFWHDSKPYGLEITLRPNTKKEYGRMEITILQPNTFG